MPRITANFHEFVQAQQQEQLQPYQLGAWNSLEAANGQPNSQQQQQQQLMNCSTQKYSAHNADYTAHGVEYSHGVEYPSHHPPASFVAAAAHHYQQQLHPHHQLMARHHHLATHNNMLHYQHDEKRGKRSENVPTAYFSSGIMPLNASKCEFIICFFFIFVVRFRYSERNFALDKHTICQAGKFLIRLQMSLSFLSYF